MTPDKKKSSYTLEEVMQMYGAEKPQVQPSIQASQEAANPYNAVFRAKEGEGPVKAGLKSLGNVPTSAFTLGKGIVNAAMNPLDTLKGVGGLVTDVGRKFTNKLTDVTGLGQKVATPALDALGNAYFGEQGRYGSFENAQKTATEDPFGVGSDILSIVSGGAGAFGKGSTLARGITATGKTVTSPVARTVSGFSDKVSKTVRFGVSQATGLSPETVSTIAKQRGAFSEAQKAGTTRTDLAENVLGAVKTAQDELSDVGSVYDTVRKSGTTVTLPDTWVQSALDKYRLKLSDGKVISDRTSATRNTTDINKIEEFLSNWGDAKNLTPEEYLNMRHDLAELAKYDMSGKSTVVRQFAQDVREGMLNSDQVRNQIGGLKELDAQYAADKTFLTKIEKDFIDSKTGNLKDGAASKVVNSINAANPERLARLEQLYPGFTKQAKVVKALEDIETSMGIKTGTYVRAGVGVSAAVTGNIPVAIAAILSTPEIAVPLIKGYGWTAEQAAPLLKAVRDAASDINNFRVPGAIDEYIKEKYPDGVPVGLSVKASISPEQKLEVAKALEGYDTTPMSVKKNGSEFIHMSGAEDDLLLSKLQEKNARGSFTDADALEAQRLLKRRGVLD